ncbi:MAG: zinc transporter ZntB [Alphaproteobacteria bacterium]|nr:zinc transporter ZntB [Alphaproteobacteria bacterium]
MAKSKDLLSAYVLDGNGAGRTLDWNGVRAWTPGDGVLWLHFDRRGELAREWLRSESGVDPVIAEALLTKETRPRVTAQDKGLLVILRGVNLNPGEEPEDMVPIRMWVEEQRIISFRRRKLKAAQDMRELIGQGRGPRGAGDFLSVMTSRLVDRMGPVIADLDDQVDDLEDQALGQVSDTLSEDLADVRRRAIALRRYIAPQRDALLAMVTEEMEWLDRKARSQLRETLDRTLRFVEDLDNARERVQVIQDEMSSRLSEQINRNMYVLSVVAAIMLPLSILTGLLGVNVGGIPGTEDKWAFAIVCVLLVACGAGLFFLFRRLKWL